MKLIWVKLIWDFQCGEGGGGGGGGGVVKKSLQWDWEGKQY